MLTICTFNIQNDFNDYNISKRDKIINLLKNTGTFYCSNENKKENKKLINALFKI